MIDWILKVRESIWIFMVFRRNGYCCYFDLGFKFLVLELWESSFWCFRYLICVYLNNFKIEIKYYFRMIYVVLDSFLKVWFCLKGWGLFMLDCVIFEKYR